MATEKPKIKDYTSALRYISGGNNLLHRQIDKSTVVKIPIEIEPDYAWIEYHGTRIITYLNGGTILTDFNGWHTLTTRNRIREYTGHSCSSAGPGKRDHSMINSVLVQRKARILTDGTVLPFDGMEGVWV